jgi:hypothetical protein
LSELINKRNSFSPDHANDSGMREHLEVRLLLAVHMQKVKTVDDLDQDPLDEDPPSLSRRQPELSELLNKRKIPSPQTT